MALVSDIEIRLRADIARLQQDMDRARQQVGGAMSKITQLAKGAAGALAAIGAGMAVGALANFVKSAIDATDAVSDISQRTGVAIKDIAGLQLWFQIGGAEASEFESSMIKLAKTIDSGGEAFKRIGVATRNADGSLRSNMQVLLDAGDAFSKLEDGTAKTALAVELFGKSGATLIPILNSGSEGLREMTEMADKLGLTFDEQTVEAAGQFNDTLDFLGLAAQGVGRQLAAQLLPALNSVAGSFLDFVVKGDGVKKMAAGISAVLKTLYTVGISVYTVFKTVGNTLAAMAAQVVAILTGDFAAVSRIGQVWKDEVAADFTSAAKTIVDVWNDAGGETVEALSGMGKKTGEIAAKASKDAEKQAEAYKTLIRSLQDRADATQRELERLEPLNEAEKAHIDLTRQIADGKLNLTKAQKLRAESLIDEARANEVLAASNKQYEELLEKLASNARDLAEERSSLIESAKEEVKQNEFLVETFGMTEAAIMFVQAARLKEQEAQRLGRALTAEEIEDLNRVIELKERSARAVANRAQLEKTKEFWTDIEKTAHDTFVSITDGGKNAFQRLKDTAKNTFFDWLYQQTLKKWIINIGTSVAGAGGVSGIAQAAGSAGGAGEAFSLAGAANSLYGSLTGGATLAGGLGTGFLGSLAGGLEGLVGASATRMGLTSSLGVNIGNSIASVVGPNVASGIATGLSGLAAAAPWVAGALAVYTIGKKAFGRGPKEFSGNSTIEGAFGANGLSASQMAEWTKKGGWFRSNKKGTDPMALSAETSAALSSAYDAIKVSSADFARVLGVNADSIMNRTQAIKIALTKDEAANEKAIADFFTGVADAVASEIVPNIAQFQQAGESAAAALQRVTVNFAAVDHILAELGTNSQTVFQAVGVASLAARERLVALTGGIEEFAQQATFFNQNFLSQAEQIAIISGPLNKQLETLGYAGITSAEQFKEAVQSLISSGASATEEGAKRLAGLLAIAPQFKTVADYLKELSDAAAETAQNAKDAADALSKQNAELAAQVAAQALADNESALRSGLEAAFAAVGRSVQAEKDRVSAAFQDTMAVLEARIGRVNEAIKRTTDLSAALKGAVGVVSSDMQAAASRTAAQAQIRQALTMAKATGILPSADDLKDALSALGQDATDQFSSLADYQRDVARTNADIAALGGLSDKQLSEAQRQLMVLEASKEQSRIAYEAEVARLDSILAWAQAEVDAINGVRTDIQNLTAAMAEFRLAAQGIRTGAAPSNPGGRNLTVEELYRTVLGREGEAAGIEFWKRAFGESVDASEYKDFLKGAQPELEMQERQRRQAEAANGLMSGTMSSKSASGSTMSDPEMKAEMRRTADAVTQLAAQFNSVSGGGNALLSEFA